MSTRRAYAGFTVAVLAIEILIALYLRDDFVRPFLGDTLVVVLLFCGLRALLTRAPALRLALGVLVLACAVEVSQAFDLVSLLGMAENLVVSTILGRTFSWMDFVAYLAGFGACLPLERALAGPRPAGPGASPAPTSPPRNRDPRPAGLAAGRAASGGPGTPP